MSNAFYDYCVYADNNNMALPPSDLKVISWHVNTLGDISTPLLRQGVLNGGIYLNMQTFSGFAIAWLLANPLVQIAIEIAKPDFLISFSSVLGHYNAMQTNVWHELSHAAQYNCIKTHHGAATANNYWAQVVSYEMNHALNDGTPYGTKGDYDWQRIAITEGWGKFREWYMGKRYLSYSILAPDTALFTDYTWGNQAFEFEYAGMFQELYNAHCSMSNLERALSATTIQEFHNLLLQYEPITRHGSINIIMSNY